MRLLPDIGLATIVLAALAGGAWAQGGPKSAPPDARRPADRQVVVYTKDRPPATPGLEDLELTESVSRWGVTWTFGKPVRVGRFVSGDFYVVGPVVVTGIDPAPRYGKEVADDELDGREKVAVKDRCRNGSMLNVPARREVAWDSGVLNYYHFEHRARLPIAMKPGDSLASGISLCRGERVTYPYHAGTVRGEGDNSPVKIVAVLTCVADPLPPDAFRPGYSGHDPKIYLARDLRRELLPRFDKPAEAPDAVQAAALLERPWCDSCFFLRRSPERDAQLRPGECPGVGQCLALGLLPAEAGRQGTAAGESRPGRHRLLQPGAKGPSGLARSRRPWFRPQVPHRLRRGHARRPAHGQHQQELPSGRLRRGRADRLRRSAGPAPRWCSPAIRASTS